MHATPWVWVSPTSAGATQGMVASAKLTRDNQTKPKPSAHRSSAGCQQARRLLQGCSFILISNLFNEPTMAKCQIQRLQGWTTQLQGPGSLSGLQHSASSDMTFPEPSSESLGNWFEKGSPPVVLREVVPPILSVRVRVRMAGAARGQCGVTGWVGGHILWEERQEPWSCLGGTPPPRGSLRCLHSVRAREEKDPSTVVLPSEVCPWTTYIRL